MKDRPVVKSLFSILKTVMMGNKRAAAVAPIEAAGPRPIRHTVTPDRGSLADYRNRAISWEEFVQQAPTPQRNGIGRS